MTDTQEFHGISIGTTGDSSGPMITMSIAKELGMDPTLHVAEEQKSILDNLNGGGEINIVSHEGLNVFQLLDTVAGNVNQTESGNFLMNIIPAINALKAGVRRAHDEMKGNLETGNGILTNTIALMAYGSMVNQFEKVLVVGSHIWNETKGIGHPSFSGDVRYGNILARTLRSVPGMSKLERAAINRIMVGGFDVDSENNGALDFIQRAFFNNQALATVNEVYKRGQRIYLLDPYILGINEEDIPEGAHLVGIPKITPDTNLPDSVENFVYEQKENGKKLVFFAPGSANIHSLSTELLEQLVAVNDDYSYVLVTGGRNNFRDLTNEARQRIHVVDFVDYWSVFPGQFDVVFGSLSNASAPVFMLGGNTILGSLGYPDQQPNAVTLQKSGSGRAIPIDAFKSTDHEAFARRIVEDLNKLTTLEAKQKARALSRLLIQPQQSRQKMRRVLREFWNIE